MLERLNSRKDKVYPEEEFIELIKNICPIRNKLIETKKKFINPGYNKCQNCKFDLLPSQDIRISKIWKTTYYFCNDNCWQLWCNEFNR